MNTLSQKQRQDVRDILAWLRATDGTPDPEMEDKFVSTLTGIVRENMEPPTERVLPKAEGAALPIRRLYGDRPHPLSLKAIMREATGDENYELPKMGKQAEDIEDKKAVEEKEDRGDFDSIALSRVLIYFSMENGHRINMSQLQVILYIAYGVYLAKNGRRLCGEHPQMWEYGPVFPKAYNSLRKHPSDGEDEADELEKARPEVYEFLKKCFMRFAWTSATALTVPHTAAGSPWAQTRKKSPDKWGIQIDDGMISEWFLKKI